MQVAKYCCIPICNGEKFSLVHKFPSDIGKYNEWIQIIENANNKKIPNKMQNLSHEQIKKRFFVCSRHFGIKSYKSKLNYILYENIKN